jgi:uncharacterized membrane protein (UPF0136 family)
MNTTNLKRQIVASILLILFIALRLRSLTGPLVHQGIAFMLFIVLGVHVVMHRKWIKHTIDNWRSPTLPARNRKSLIIAGCFSLNFHVSLISGILITSTFAAYMPAFIIQARPGLVITHVASSLVLIAMLIAHSLMNLRTVKTWFRRKPTTQAV